MLSTLITHFLNRELATKDSKAREELLYDEAFTIVKVRPVPSAGVPSYVTYTIGFFPIQSFMEASTK